MEPFFLWGKAIPLGPPGGTFPWAFRGQVGVIANLSALLAPSQSHLCLAVSCFQHSFTQVLAPPWEIIKSQSSPVLSSNLQILLPCLFLLCPVTPLENR